MYDRKQTDSLGTGGSEFSFDLEYGSVTFAIQSDAAVAEGKRVLIIDDLLAKG